MNVLGFVPARGGSKRFPRKNAALLGGRPLLAWTLEAARASDIFATIAVSTDDDAIAAIAADHGARVIARDPAFAADDRTVVDVVLADLAALEAAGECYDAVYVLMPTSPFRSAVTIARAFAAFRDGGATGLVSVMPLDVPPEWALVVDAGVVRARDPQRYVLPRVALEPSFRADGAHLIASVAALRAQREFIGPATVAFHSPEHERLDIDTARDLAFAEFLLEAGAEVKG